jgi:peptidoglycan/LPS O-acetylase OafA/YrhL
MDAQGDARRNSPENPDKNASSSRLHYLDGLRGWAALSVVIYHVTWELFGKVVPGMAGTRLLLNDGLFAVYVFFVLSGFVLSKPYLASGDIERLRATAVGRSIRLTIPIATASFLTFVLLKCGAMPNGPAGVIVDPSWLKHFYRFDPSFLAYAKFSLYDVYFSNDVTKSYDVVLWTMPTELVGSFLIFTLIALFGGNLALRSVSCVAALFVCAQYDTWLLTFVFGYLLAELHTHVRDARITTGAVGNAIGFSLLATAALYRFDHDGIRTCGLLATCVVAAPIFSSFLRAVLAAPVSRWLGRLSFPLYLVHSAVICSLSAYLIIALDQLSWSPSGIAAVVIPVTIVASLFAAQAFEPIERFAIRSAHRFAGLLLTRSRSVFQRKPPPSLGYRAVDAEDVAAARAEAG